MVIYLHDKRRQVAEWLPKLQHLIGGIPLLLSGAKGLAEESERPVAFLEIAIAVIVLATFAKELRAELHAKGKHSHSSFGWFDLAAGALLIFEAFHGAHHKPGYLRPQFLSGVATIALGLFHAPFHRFQARRRYLKLDEEGVEFRVARFRHLKLEWSSLRSIDVSGRCAVFERTDGRRHKVRLNALHDADEIRQAIREHALTAGVKAD